MNPRGAGWVVKRTGPYTPIISFAGLTIYRLFILSFIYIFPFKDTFIKLINRKKNISMSIFSGNIPDISKRTAQEDYEFFHLTAHLVSDSIPPVEHFF